MGSFRPHWTHLQGWLTGQSDVQASGFLRTSPGNPNVQPGLRTLAKEVLKSCTESPA